MLGQTFLMTAHGAKVHLPARFSRGRYALVALAALATISCGKKDERSSATTASSSASPIASGGSGRTTCNMIPVAGKCDEYSREDPLGMAKGLCEGYRGVYSISACPQDGLVGTCALKGDDRRRYYVTKDDLTSFSPDDARKDCESDLVLGKFTPVANPPKKPAAVPSGSASAAQPQGAPTSSKRR